MSVYISIDLKSFYASAECVSRGLNPMDANLVVADASRTEKTICLAVSPALKAYGISGRARLFEVVARVREINGQRCRRALLRRSFTAVYTALRRILKEKIIWSWSFSAAAERSSAPPSALPPAVSRKLRM